VDLFHEHHKQITWSKIAMMLKTLGLLGWPVEGCSWACESMQTRSRSGAQFPSSKAASAVRILYAAQTDDMLDHIYFPHYIGACTMAG
jgi:hypothetical protein